MKAQLRYLLLLLGALFLTPNPGHAQQIVCEWLLNTPGIDVRWPTACVAPNGEFIVTGAAGPTGALNLVPASHTFVTRLQTSGCDTLWTRRLPHSVTYYDVSAVRADARGIWLLTPDTVLSSNLAAPFRGARLWQLTSAGRVRRIVRLPAANAREFPNDLLPIADGGGYAYLHTQSPRVGIPKAPVVLRFDSTGVVRWRRNYGYALNYFGSSLCAMPTGHLLLTGMVGVGTNYDGHAKLLEVETNRGDSLSGATLPWGANVNYESVLHKNAQPMNAITLTGGGYALLSRVNTTQANPSEQLARVDANYNVVWRYQLPPYGVGGDFLTFNQVRELADGTLVALVRPFFSVRTFWLYRFNVATGALLNVYPFTSAFGAFEVSPSHLLPVASDSSLLVVGGSRLYNTNQVGGIYVARLRVPRLPRVVAPALPLAARSGVAGARLGVPYPNPAGDWLRVPYSLPRGGAGSAHLEVRNALGQLLWSAPLSPNAGEAQVAVSQLPTGLYQIALVASGQPAATQRFAVTR